MKVLKDFVIAVGLLIGVGTVSLASAVGFSPINTAISASGVLTFKSPTTFQTLASCNVTLNGTISALGEVNIPQVIVNGSNLICGSLRMTNLPWLIKATSLSGANATGIMTNVGFTLSIPSLPMSNCGPSIIGITYSNTSQHLIATNQPLSGSCTVQNLDLTVSTPISVPVIVVP